MNGRKNLTWAWSPRSKRKGFTRHLFLSYKTKDGHTFIRREPAPDDEDETRSYRALCGVWSGSGGHAPRIGAHLYWPGFDTPREVCANCEGIMRAAVRQYERERDAQAATAS